MSDGSDRDGPRSGDDMASFAVHADPTNVLHLSGELDAASAPTLARALAPLTVRGGVIGLDLAGLTFMDSTGIKALCQAHERLGEQGRIVLFRPTPFVVRVLGIAGLGEIFELADERCPSLS